jgi:hypothetical protein
MGFALYELALQPEIQHRLRAEIMKVLSKHNGQPTYYGIQDMSYLDMVLSGEGIETGWFSALLFNTSPNHTACFCLRVTASNFR